MSPEALLERVIAEVDPNELARARDEYHALAGPFAPADPFYEERIRAFLDWLVIERNGGTTLRSFLARHRELSDTDQALGRALLSSMRSLYRVHQNERDTTIQCVFDSARFMVQTGELPASRLRDGDMLDGRALGIEGVVMLAPGPVFHPREAHAAIETLVRQAREQKRSETNILDSLLRMRMRFDRFHSIRAEHVYRLDALDRTEILAASWAS
jgi:hypothetical protein